MKSTVILIIVFLLTTSFLPYKNHHISLVLKIAPANMLRTTARNKQHPPNGPRYPAITATLTNTASDTLKYYSMCCSWWDTYSTNIDGLHIAAPGCDKNFPTIESIPPGQSVERSFELVTNRESYQEKSLQLKMAFYYVPGNYKRDFRHWINFKTEGTPVWSNAITLTE